MMPALLRLRLALVMLALAGSTLARAQPGQAQSLPTITLNAGMHLIRAQVADSDGTRQTGLMHRKDMPANDGMLFVFDEANPQCFWMRNTLLPLTIAFVADDGTIVNLADMQPMTERSHCSAKPVRFALEMNLGWFAKRGIKAGAKLGGAAFAR